MTTVPPKFFLYFPNRSVAKDPHSGFVLMDAVIEDTAWRITPAPNDFSTTYTRESAQVNITYLSAVNVHHKFTAGVILQKSFEGCAFIKMSSPDGVVVPVYIMHNHTTVFGSSILKRNVKIVDAQTDPVAPAPAPAPLRKPKIAMATELSPFVAKQLLELARLKHEMCPITVEEFSIGNTAVMPCGHLFMQLAIEESFKKEANKCPVCRQLGSPTLV